MNETVHANVIWSERSAHHAKAVCKVLSEITHPFWYNVTKSVRMAALTGISLRPYKLPLSDLVSMSVISLGNFPAKL